MAAENRFLFELFYTSSSKYDGGRGGGAPLAESQNLSPDNRARLPPEAVPR